MPTNTSVRVNCHRVSCSKCNRLKLTQPNSTNSTPILRTTACQLPIFSDQLKLAYYCHTHHITPTHASQKPCLVNNSRAYTTC